MVTKWKKLQKAKEKILEWATLYELRLLFAQGEKNEYTKEDIVKLLDKIAMEK